MRPVLSSRRAAAVAAAAAIGLSTAVLSAPGVASATPVWEHEFTADENIALPVPNTVCTAVWELTGAAGGDSAQFSGGLGDLVTATTMVPSGGTLLVQPGQRGTSSAGGGMGGSSGAESSGGAGGAGAGGGGGASVVRIGNSPTMDVLLVAGGGGGAGSQADGGHAGTAGGTWTAPGGAYTGGAPGTMSGPGAGGTTPGGSGTPGAGGGGGSGRGGGEGNFGGGSGSSDGTDGSGGGGGGSQFVEAGVTVSPAQETDGSVRVTFLPCTPPVWSGFLGQGTVGDGRLSVVFAIVNQQWVHPDRALANGWEISLDDGATWQPATTGPGVRIPGAGPGWTSASITLDGLENGRTYAVRVRATSAVGPGQASPTRLLTPQAPADVPPTTPVAAPSAVPVAAPSGAGVPPTVPPANGPLDAGPGASVAPGGQMTVSGTGYRPGSTVDLYVYSTPVKVGTATADANGVFSAVVTLPAGLAAGTHHLVAAGVDPSGNPRYLVQQVSVTTAASSSTPGLADTGAEPLPLLIGAGALLLAGTALTSLGRRRTA